MPEHTPAPTPDRAVYGLALFILFKALFIVYIVWVYVPQHFLEEILGLTYLPDKYFALFIPILIMVGLWIFAFCIYPILGITKTANIDSIYTICDQHTIRRCQYEDSNGTKCNNVILNEADDARNGIYFKKFCDAHVNDRDEDIQKCDNHITDYCDCHNDERCQIKSDLTYINQLKLRKAVPSAYDLDITDVCKNLYGGN